MLVFFSLVLFQGFSAKITIVHSVGGVSDEVTLRTRTLSVAYLVTVHCVLGVLVK